MSPARISRDDVIHVARLARLALTEDEISEFTDQLASILEHAAGISSLDLAGLEPTAHPIPLSNVLRPDVPRPGVDREEVLAAAPETQDGRFRVPRILGDAS